MPIIELNINILSLLLLSHFLFDLPRVLNICTLFHKKLITGGGNLQSRCFFSKRPKKSRRNLFLSQANLGINYLNVIPGITFILSIFAFLSRGFDTIR